MNLFSTEIGSRGYHGYRDTIWRDIRVNQPVVVCQETNPLSKVYDPYCCKITISRRDRIGPVTVGHVPREISRYVYYFLHEESSRTLKINLLLYQLVVWKCLYGWRSHILKSG